MADPYGLSLGARAAPPLSRVAQVVGDDAENSILQNVGRFLSRPGWAVRSLLTGDVEGAARNVGQFLIDLPTGGFLNRNFNLASIANLALPEEYELPEELTDKRHRPEMTQVLREWGVPTPRSTGGRLALDVVGGMATDPLTYLTLGGSGLAKGSLTGVGRSVAASRVAGALGGTKAGQLALQNADDALRAIPRFASNPSLRRLKAAEDVIKSVTPGLRKLGERAPVEVLDTGVDALKQAGLIRRGGIGVGLPFSKPAFEVGSDFWPKVGNYATAPGWARGALRRLAPDTAQVVDTAADDLWRGLKGKFYDKTLKGIAPEGLRHEARRGSYQYAGDLKRADQTVEGLFGDWAPPQREAFSAAMRDAGDTYQSMRAAGASHQRAFAEADSTLSRGLKGVMGEVGEVRVGKTLKGFMDTTKGIQDELVKLGVWEKAYGDVFYLPHQATDEIADLLAASSKNKALRRGLKDVFTQRRTYRTTDEFVAALRKVAEDHGVPLEAADSVMELDAAKLLRRRLQAHARTVQRVTLTNKAKRLGMVEGDALHAYVQGQFEGLAPRQSFVTKLLGGGHWNLPAQSEAIQEIAKKRGWKIKDGAAQVPWKGLNYLIKPGLTTMNPGFHVRNWISAIFMSGFDPDMKAPGVIDGALATFRKAPLIKRLSGLTDDSKLIGHLLGALDNNADDVAALAGRKIGRYDAMDVAEQLKGFLGDTGLNQSDLMLELTDEFGRQQFGKGPLNKWIEWGTKVADETEKGYRANLYLKLLKDGVDPTDAMQRVERAFVNYSRQSEVERAVRDIFPFARFTIGSSAWVKEFAQRPRLISPFYRAQFSAQGEGDFLPESVRDSPAIPVGTDPQGNTIYLTGFGMPHEAVIGNLGMLSGPEGFRRRGLSALNPVLRTPLEAATNRSFFFGSEFGEYRRAPSWLPDTFTDEIELPSGEKRQEVSGTFNELVGATPASRLLGTLDKFLDKRRGKVEAVLYAATGTRTQHVDVKREAKKAILRWAEAKIDSGELGEVRHLFFRKGKLGQDDMPEDLKITLQALKDLRRDQ